MPIPTPPTPPSVPVPRWAYNSPTSERRDPGDAKRAQGWGYYNQSSTQLGEAPPYQTENYNKNIAGSWCDYFNQVIAYVAQFYGNVTTSDSNYENFLALSQDSVVTIVSPNSPNLVQLNATRASRYPTNITTSPWDGTTFKCPVQDYYDITFQCSLLVTDYTTRLNSSTMYNLVETSIYKNNVPYVSNRIGGNFAHSDSTPLMKYLSVSETIYCQKGDLIQFYINNLFTNLDYSSFCPMTYGNITVNYLVPGLTGTINRPGVNATIAWNFSP